MQKIRFTFRKGHHNYRAFAKHLDAEFVQVKSAGKTSKWLGIEWRNQLLISVANALRKSLTLRKQHGTTYLLSGLQPIFLPLFMRLLRRERNKIVLIGCDESFVMEGRGPLARAFYHYLFRHIDAAICVSPMVASDAIRYLSGPVEVVGDPIWRGYSHFSDIKPDLRSKTFIFVGDYRKHKGIDILAQAMKLIKDKDPEVKMIFVGRNIEQELKSRGLHQDWFEYTGFADPKEHFGRAAFYIHTARYEPSGTVIFEAMASGLIPIVSVGTGNDYVVKEIDESLYIPSREPQAIADQVLDLLSTFKLAQRRSLSKKAMKRAQQNDVAKVNELFARTLRSVHTQIQNYVFVTFNRRGGGHPLHATWARTLNMRTVSYAPLSILPWLRNHPLLHQTAALLQSFRIPQADAYLLDSPACTAALWTKWGKSTLISINSDTFFYDLSKASGLRKRYKQWLLGHIDGFVSTSAMMKEMAERHTGKPNEVCLPFIDVKKYSDVKADLKSKNICSVGIARKSKGSDLLLDMFKTYRDQEPEARLHMVGLGDMLDAFRAQEGAIAPGRDDPSKHFPHCFAYVASSRHDSFGISIAEAMCSGLMPIITDTCGAKELVAAVAPELIVPADANALLEKLKEVKAKSPQEKRRISLACRRKAKQLTEEKSLRSFKEAFLKLTGVRP